MDTEELKSKIEKMLQEAKNDAKKPYPHVGNYIFADGRIFALEEVLELFKCQ